MLYTKIQSQSFLGSGEENFQVFLPYMGIAAILFNCAEPFDWLCWGLTTRQSLRVILCRLPEKGRKEIEERVEEMKERDREERGTGMKVKKQKK